MQKFREGCGKPESQMVNLMNNAQVKFQCCVIVPYNGKMYLATPSIGAQPAWSVDDGPSASLDLYLLAAQIVMQTFTFPHCFKVCEFLTAFECHTQGHLVFKPFGIYMQVIPGKNSSAAASSAPLAVQPVDDEAVGQGSKELSTEKDCNRPSKQKIQAEANMDVKVKTG